MKKIPDLASSFVLETINAFPFDILYLFKLLGINLGGVISETDEW